jgi:hypothetical protein
MRWWSTTRIPAAAAARCCGTLLRGDDPNPVRHQVLEIPPIVRRHRKLSQRRHEN